MEIISRADARARGMKRFHTGLACRHGHVESRFVSTGSCVRCTHIAKRASPSMAGNQDRANATSSFARARYRGATLVPAVSWRDVLPFYAEARRLTNETGIPHDVDHIIPCCEGGDHAPWNLRVIPASENRSRKFKPRT